MVDTVVGTDSPNYTPVTADVAANIYCRVTATNAAGSASADSNTVGPVTAAGGGGPFAYLADTEGQGNDSIVTSAIDTTGAGLLIAVMNDFSSHAQISDNKGNTWTFSPGGDGSSAKFWYCYNPTSVGPGHTITVLDPVSGLLVYAAVCFVAFSGGATGELDTANSGSSDMRTPVAPHTPAQDNSLILSIVYLNDDGGGTSSIDDGFTMICDLPRTGQLGLCVAYLIQTTAAEFQPTWTIPGATTGAFFNVVFSSMPLAMARPVEESNNA